MKEQIYMLSSCFMAHQLYEVVKLKAQLASFASLVFLSYCFIFPIWAFSSSASCQAAKTH